MTQNAPCKIEIIKSVDGLVYTFAGTLLTCSSKTQRKITLSSM